MRRRSLALICLACLFLTSILALMRVHGSEIEGSFTLYPSEDTLVDKELPNSQAWTTSTGLQLGNTSAHEHIGYFKFNLTEAYRGTLTIDFLTLSFYMNNLDQGSVGAEIDLYDTNNETWDDSTITWNNRPALDMLEVYDSVVTTQPKYYTFWISEAGNSTYHVGGVQDAYNNNLTRTFAMAFFRFEALMNWNSVDASSYKPYMTVWYTQTETEEETTPPPTIVNPTVYTLTYFVFEDSVVQSFNASANKGTENISQIEYNSGSGNIAYLYLKFNLTFPDRINGYPNTDNLTMTTLAWRATVIKFKQYCNFSSTDSMWWGDNILQGIPRSNETSWNQTSITWNNKPVTRGYLTLRTNIDSMGYKEYDLLEDEDFIRFTISNETTYSLVHQIDQRSTRQAFNNWVVSEYGSFLPYIEMTVTTEPLGFSTEGGLSWTSAPSWLAVQWSVTPFIAGHLLAGMVFTVTVVPISFILRKGVKGDLFKYMLLVAVFLSLTVFVWFSWIHMGVYVSLLIIAGLYFGGVFNR